MIRMNSNNLSAVFFNLVEILEDSQENVVDMTNPKNLKEKEKVKEVLLEVIEQANNGLVLLKKNSQKIMWEITKEYDGLGFYWVICYEQNLMEVLKDFPSGTYKMTKIS